MSTTDANSEAASRFQSMNLGNDDSIMKTEDADYTNLYLSELESNILDLYDRLQRLNLEMAHLIAQSTARDSRSSHQSRDCNSNTYPVPGQEVTEELLKESQENLLEAQARYNLKNKIVESVLIANPILKAVHASTSTTPLERDLLPLITARDSVSTQLTSTSQSLLTTRSKLRDAEIQNIQLAKSNQEKAGRMIQLAKEAGADKKEVVEGKARERIEEIEQEVRAGKQRWRVMKGTASAVVAGSGVDWGRDERLRGLVLEDESDDE